MRTLEEHAARECLESNMFDTLFIFHIQTNKKSIF